MLDFVKSHQMVHSAETGERGRVGGEAYKLSMMTSDDEVYGPYAVPLLSAGKSSG